MKAKRCRHKDGIHTIRLISGREVVWCMVCGAYRIYESGIVDGKSTLVPVKYEKWRYPTRPYWKEQEVRGEG